MRAMWTGSISFGLVNIPVKLYAATQKKEIKFRYLHKECQTPLEYKKKCPICQEEVEWNELTRGYEYEKGHFVIVDDNELEQLQGEKTKTIDIVDFVNLSEIDPVYYDRSYYLSPSDTGVKPYALLHKALAETGKIGLAKVILRTREMFASVRTMEELLVMETMFYPDEIRSGQDLPGINAHTDLKENELAMAQELIERLSSSFSPQKYQDSYRLAVESLIKAKIEGQEVSIAPPRDKEKVIDLMDALKASVDQARKEDENKKKKKKKKEKEPSLAGKTS